VFVSEIIERAKLKYAQFELVIVKVLVKVDVVVVVRVTDIDNEVVDVADKVKAPDFVRIVPEPTTRTHIDIEKNGDIISVFFI
jgi:hypothetical protein